MKLTGILMVLFLSVGCSMTPKQPALHDFGLTTPAPLDTGRPEAEPMITVDAPSWLWDTRIRYRLLYKSLTHIGFYALDLWIAPPPELFRQQLLAGGKLSNYRLIIRLLEFEQQFDALDKARVVLRFSAEARSPDNQRTVGIQTFRLEQATASANAAGAVAGFAGLTRQATDRIHGWLSGLAGK